MHWEIFTYSSVSDLFYGFHSVDYNLTTSEKQRIAMPLLLIFILALIQGITEFLPVSSSAHLILVHEYFGNQQDAVALDIAVHFGSLFAVMLFFKTETKMLFMGAFDLLRLNLTSQAAQLLLKLAYTTIPVVVLGLALELGNVIDLIRSPIVIAISMIFFGIVLYFADQKSAATRTFEDWNWRDALIMGLWQAVALIPGTSRSGATVTASRILGFERSEGAKIAMLMSIPTILAASLLLLVKITKAPADAQLGVNALIAALTSFIAAYFALKLMMRFLKSTSYTPYVIYRILLGVVLLWIYL